MFLGLRVRIVVSFGVQREQGSGGTTNFFVVIIRAFFIRGVILLVTKGHSTANIRAVFILVLGRHINGFRRPSGKIVEAR